MSALLRPGRPMGRTMRTFRAACPTGFDALPGHSGFSQPTGWSSIPVDADRLQALYRDTQHRVTSEFQFPDPAVLPEMEHVTEAYLGVVPAKEYLKLIVG